MGARAYNAAEGRFTSVDPQKGGCANGYVYVFGDPLSQTDLTGMESSCRWQDFVGLWATTAATILGGGELAGVEGAEGLGVTAGNLLLGAVGASADGAACKRDTDKSACVGTGLGILAELLGFGGAATKGLTKGVFDSHAFGAGTGGLFADVFSSANGVATCGQHFDSWAWNKIKSIF